MFANAADGTRLHYIVLGGGPPVVLVGGKASTIEGAWWRYLPVLSREFRVIAFDHRGAGQSDAPDVPYTTTLLAEDALTVLTAAGERSAHWFGLSLGGMALQELALLRGDAARSLILGGTHCGGPPSPRPPKAQERSVLGASRNRRFANLYSPTFLLEHPDWVAADAAHFGRMPLHAIVRQDQAAVRHHACDRLHRITCPVMILHGSEDRLVPLARAQELHRLLPQSELRIVPGGHQFFSESFDEVLRAVIDFIHDAEKAQP